MSNERGQEEREDLRSNVFLTGHLQSGDRSFVVRVRNISARGAMLDGPNLPQKGSVVRLDRGSLSATATVAWQAGDIRGVRFDQSIEVSEWVKRTGHAGQQRVDRAVQALRAGVQAPQVEMGHRSIRQLAEDLRQICEQIAMAPDLSIQVGEALVRIESIAVELISQADHR